MNAVMFDSLNLLGVPNSQVRLRRPGPERYERLYLLPGLSTHGHRYSSLAIDALELVGASIEKGEPTNIWVSRSDTDRRLVHEDEVCDALRTLGWAIASTGQMRFHDQIRLFKGAKKIAGVTGAGLANIAFAPHGTPVIFFMPAEMPDIFYWSIASIKEQAYREIRCAPVAGTEGGNWNGLLEMSVDEVLALVAK
jgi:capsular polysaccharide biosynthesis protein